MKTTNKCPDVGVKCEYFVRTDPTARYGVIAYRSVETIVISTEKGEEVFSALTRIKFKVEPSEEELIEEAVHKITLWQSMTRGQVEVVKEMIKLGYRLPHKIGSDKGE